MKNKLILKRIGLYNPTEVEYGNKILVTQGLDIESLTDLWKWYFNLKCFSKIALYVANKKDFNSMEQKTLTSVKSVKELFEEQGFDIKLLEDETEIVSDWKLYRKSERGKLCNRMETAREILKPLYDVVIEHSDCCVNLSEDIKFLMEKYGINLEEKKDNDTF